MATEDIHGLDPVHASLGYLFQFDEFFGFTQVNGQKCANLRTKPFVWQKNYRSLTAYKMKVEYQRSQTSTMVIMQVRD